MELTLLRHGIPVEPGEWSDSDSTRPLTTEGRVKTRAVIARLVAAGRLAAGPSTGAAAGPGVAMGPGAGTTTDARAADVGAPFDAVWVSPYLRTRQTAEIALEVLGLPPSMVRFTPALASGVDLSSSLPAYAAGRFPARLLCVGHNPHISGLVAWLAGERDGGRYSLGRAGTARLTGEFKRGGMKLEWLLSAEEALGL
jgi:phosphohistidine phosphatase SixA